MLNQAEYAKSLPTDAIPSHLNAQLETRANEAEQALLSLNAKSIETEEELKEGIECLNEYEKEYDKWKRRARRMSRWYHAEKGYDFSDREEGGTGWPEYEDEDEEEEIVHVEEPRLPNLMDGKSKDIQPTTADKVRQQQSVPFRAQPRAGESVLNDEAIAMGMSQDQYIARAQSQHVETLSFGQEADPTRQRLFSNEPSKNERVMMLNYRVAKMVNLMSWAYTRALMTEFKAHMHYVIISSLGHRLEKQD